MMGGMLGVSFCGHRDKGTDNEGAGGKMRDR